MRPHLITFSAPLIGLVLGALPFGASAQSSAPSNSSVPLALVQRIPMPNVTHL